MVQDTETDRKKYTHSRPILRFSNNFSATNPFNVADAVLYEHPRFSFTLFTVNSLAIPLLAT